MKKILLFCLGTISLLGACQLKDQVVQSSMEGSYICRLDLDKTLSDSQVLDSLESARHKMKQELSTFSSETGADSSVIYNKDLAGGLQQMGEGLLQMTEGISKMALGLGKTLAENATFRLDLQKDGKASVDGSLANWSSNLDELRWSVKNDSIYFTGYEAGDTTDTLGFHWASSKPGHYVLSHEHIVVRLERAEK